MISGTHPLRKCLRSSGAGLRQALKRYNYSTSSVCYQAPKSTSSLQTLPKFPSFFADASKHIQILYEPKTFYSWFLESIEHAQKRIFISALYLGKEEEVLISKLHEALGKNPELQVYIILDGLRSTREYPSPTGASLLSVLHNDFPKQVHTYYYHTPELSGLWKRTVPRKFDEGWGVWHAKIFGFDDNVMMSGANLSKMYFNDRQDRYWIFKQHRPLADFLHEFIKTCSEFSFRYDFSTSNLYWPSKTIPSPISDPTGFKTGANELINKFLDVHNEPRAKTGTPTREEYDTLIRPFIQMGPIGIKQESSIIVPSIIDAANSFTKDVDSPRHDQKSNAAKVDWTSGYFSLDESYKQLLLSKCQSDVSIICCGPSANGFLNSKGITKHIPSVYTHLEKQFWDKHLHYKNKNVGPQNMNLREWARPGWTYHGKGIWLSPPADSESLSLEDIDSRLKCFENSDIFDRDSAAIVDKNNNKSDASTYPVLTAVGSSNFGPRSASRDMELNLIVTTTNTDLRKEMYNEVQHLNEWTECVNNDSFNNPDRQVPLFVKVILYFARDMF